MSSDAVQARLHKIHAIAASACPTLVGKRLHPHVLRHTTAMQLRHAGVDTAVIALWLGHQSPQTTQKYMTDDIELKERTLARVAPPDVPPGRFQPSDPLLAFLENL
jgi:integrase/recombinase XerD